MLIVCAIDVITVILLFWVVSTKGVERALPWFTFLVVLIPTDSKLEIPGFFDLTTQRVLLCTLAVLFFTYRKRPPKGEAYATPLKHLIWLHIVWSLVATVNSIDPATSAKRMLSQVFEYYLLYYIFSNTITSFASARRILTALVASVAVACALGLPEEYYGWSVMSWFPMSAAGGITQDWGRGVRMHSTFVHPILFGGAIALVIPATIYLLRDAVRPFRRVVLWMTLLLLFLCLYKTLSRGPWLGAILSVALLTIFGGSKIRKPILVVAVLVLAVLIIRPGVWSTLQDIYYSTQDQDTPMGSSYEYRYVLFDKCREALAVSFNRQLWGFGFESFKELHLVGTFKQFPNWKFISCDSSWIELMIETGYVGMLIAACLLFKPLVLAWRTFRRGQRDQRPMAVALLVTVTSYLFMMISVNTYSWGQNGYMLWMLVALIAFTTRGYQGRGRKRSTAIGHVAMELASVEKGSLNKIGDRVVPIGLRIDHLAI